MGGNVQVSALTAPNGGGNPPPVQPFAIWIFLRLIVPTTPILIQYAMHFLTSYPVKFPQLTYITMLFSLSLATLTEYSELKAIIWGCILPSVGAAMLYTLAISNEANAAILARIELVGFGAWVFLMLLNLLRVSVQGIKRWAAQ